MGGVGAAILSPPDTRGLSWRRTPGPARAYLPTGLGYTPCVTRATEGQLGTLGAAACRCGRGASAGGGGGVLDAVAAVWDCDSRFVGAGGESAFVARVADGFPATGRSGRDSRGKIRGWISGRAV